MSLVADTCWYLFGKIGYISQVELNLGNYQIIKKNPVVKSK